MRLFPGRDLARADTEHGTCALLATTAEIDPWIMATALRVFERLTLDDQSSDLLAPLITQVGPQRRAMADFITVNPATGAVSAPGWIYDAARWNLAARIAAAPLMIDGHLPVALRMDTDGNLIAWDLPLTREPRGEGRAAHATTWISVSIITLPGAAGLTAMGYAARYYVRSRKSVRDALRGKRCDFQWVDLQSPQCLPKTRNKFPC